MVLRGSTGRVKIRLKQQRADTGLEIISGQGNNGAGVKKYGRGIFSSTRPGVAHSNLLFAFVFPFAAWDVFEEIPPALTAFRRTVMTRSLTSIFMVSLFGLLVSIPAFNPDDPLDGPFLFRLMVVVSTGSATGCLSFFWAMRRAFRLQKIPFPHNTFVWMIFYGLTLASQIAIFFIIFVEEALGQSSTSIVGQVTETTAGLYGIAVTIWCGLRLKALPKDVPSASLNEPS